MGSFTVNQIGVICVDREGFRIKLEPGCRKAMSGLEGYSHLQVLWWFSRCDNEPSRAKRTEQKPYVNGPEVLGIFATRSPERPNPIALSCVTVTSFDAANGILHLAYIDAHDQSPVLDIKPYTPSLDRVEAPEVPGWCRHWPKNVETSGDFDWASEFNF